MWSLTYIVILAIVLQTNGYAIRTRCANLCKAKKESTIRCNKPCSHDTKDVLSSVKWINSRDVINDCTLPCHCDKQDYVYPSNRICEMIQILTIKDSKDDCRCVAGYNKEQRIKKWSDRSSTESKGKIHRSKHVGMLNLRSDSTTVDPAIEKWCQKMCAEGLGGSACFCDIIP